MSDFGSPWKEVLDRYFAVLSPASRVAQPSGPARPRAGLLEGLTLGLEFNPRHEIKEKQMPWLERGWLAAGAIDIFWASWTLLGRSVTVCGVPHGHDL
jgi:hypothetical protein